MLSYLLASCGFAIATWADKQRGRRYYLAPIAYSLNAMRLLGRIVSTFAGKHWLDCLSERLYFPVVLMINSMLVVWFIVLARDDSRIRPGEIC
jgi:hypothetical protein